MFRNIFLTLLSHQTTKSNLRNIFDRNVTYNEDLQKYFQCNFGFVLRIKKRILAFYFYNTCRKIQKKNLSVARSNVHLRINK